MDLRQAIARSQYDAMLKQGCAVKGAVRASLGEFSEMRAAVKE